VRRGPGDHPPTHFGLRRTRGGVKNKRLEAVGCPQGNTGAVAEGEKESEDCIGALTSGNWQAPGPGRAKAVRVGVNFWRAPWPMREHPQERILSLAHRIDVSALERAFRRLRSKAAAGVDGVTKAEYAGVLPDLG